MYNMSHGNIIEEYLKNHPDVDFSKLPPVRSFFKRDCPFKADSDRKMYNKWYYENVRRIEKIIKKEMALENEK